MKRFAIVCVLAAGAAGVQAETFVDHARVRSVEPQYDNVSVPRTQCRSHWRRDGGRHFDGHSNSGGAVLGGYGGAVLGGVAGALVGNQVGKGHGREAATAVGAVVGAFAGDHIANGNRFANSDRFASNDRFADGDRFASDRRWERHDEEREVRRCWTVNEVQPRITGYRVHYEYRGQQYATLMREHPGQTLQVRVSVDPVQRY